MKAQVEPAHAHHAPNLQTIVADQSVCATHAKIRLLWQASLHPAYSLRPACNPCRLSACTQFTACTQLTVCAQLVAHPSCTTYLSYTSPLEDIIGNKLTNAIAGTLPPAAATVGSLANPLSEVEWLAPIPEGNNGNPTTHANPAPTHLDTAWRIKNQ